MFNKLSRAYWDWYAPMAKNKIKWQRHSTAFFALNAAMNFDQRAKPPSALRVSRYVIQDS
jgi:hypothetical protein